MRLTTGKDGGVELWFGESAEGAAMEEAGKRLEALGARLLRRADGPDQSYWDYRLGEATVTLHREHYLGVSLIARDEAGERAIKAVAEALGAR